MSEKLYKQQHFEPIEASDLLSKVKSLKADGYRMLQICATKVQEGFEILYSFDKEHKLYNYKMKISEGVAVESITGEFWPAFIYENEMHDLFGIEVKHSELDYQGKFFKLSEETPWNPKK